jgi:ketosteroid isomerase-like protein
MNLKIIFITIIITLGSIQAQDTISEIDQMLSSFVENLNDLDLEPFIENFDSEATIFYPRNSFPIDRVSGKEAIKNEFRAFFDNVRGNRTEPPFLSISPIDRELKVYNNLAVVSLHFKLGEEFHRRTILLKKRNHKWLIIHLHASFLIE